MKYSTYAMTTTNRLSRISEFLLNSIVAFLCTLPVTSHAADRLYIERGKNNKCIAIFVHGFIGDYQKTWGKLPSLLQSDDSLQGYDFLFWGYPTKLFRRGESIDAIGEHFKTEVDFLPKHYKTIVLVGHSMGGLVIRSFVVQALIDGKGAEVDRIADIILFGTPNDGLLKAELIPDMVNKQIDDMGMASDFIVRIRKYWVQRVTAATVDDSYNRRLRTLAIAGLGDRFVPKESVLSYFHETAITDGNHTSMVKPNDIHHLTYRILRTRLIAAKQDTLSTVDIPKIRVIVRNTDHMPLTVIGNGAFRITSQRALAADLEVGSGRFEIAQSAEADTFGKNINIPAKGESSLLLNLPNGKSLLTFLDAGTMSLSLYFTLSDGREVPLEKIPFHKEEIDRSEFALVIAPKVHVNEGLTVNMQLDSRHTSLVCDTNNAPIVGECIVFNLPKERWNRFMDMGRWKDIPKGYDFGLNRQAYGALVRTQRMRESNDLAKLNKRRERPDMFMVDLLKDPTMRDLLSPPGLLPSAIEWRILERNHPQEAYALMKWLIEWVGLLDPFFRVTFMNQTDRTLRINKLKYKCEYRTTWLAILMGAYKTPRYVLELKDGHHEEAFDPPVEVSANDSKSIDIVVMLKEPQPGAQYRISLNFVSDDGIYEASTQEFDVIFWKGKVLPNSGD